MSSAAADLAITHAFPVRCRLGEKSKWKRVEYDVYTAIEERKLTLVRMQPARGLLPAAHCSGAQLWQQYGLFTQFLTSPEAFRHSYLITRCSAAYIILKPLTGVLCNAAAR